MLNVMKKDGHIEVFDTKKIQEAILASARKILSNEEEYDMQQKALIIANEVARFLNSTEDENAVIMTSKIHNVVLEILSKEWEVVGASYGMYRNYRKQMAKTFLKSYEESETVLHDGDKENANKDSDLNSTKQALIANNNMRGYMETFEMDKDWIEAHKQGWIHIHDLAERYLRQQNCFSRKTSFVSDRGVISFEDLQDGDSINVLTAKGNWKKAKVKNFGKQKLNRYYLKRGSSEVKEILATSNHRWILKDGSETTNLSIGDKLLSEPKQTFDLDSISEKELLAWIQGFIYGDGNKTNVNSSKYKEGIQIRFCGEKSKFIPYFEKAGFSVSYPDFTDNEGYISSSSLPKKEFIDSNDKDLIIAFVEGYLAADGAFSNGNKDRKNRLQKTTENIEEFNKIRKYFPVAGYYITREEDLTGRSTNFIEKRKPTINFVFAYGSHVTWKVIDIDFDVAEEEVWCLQVEDDKSFVLDGGIPTGNCCLFNMSGLLDGGFQLNGTVYAEPKHFDSAINVVGDVTLFASAQQYGGFTIPEIDTVLAKYAEKSYQSNLKFILDKFGNITNEDIMEKLEQTAYDMTVRELEQGFQGFETKLNTISNSLGQIPFVTITFGLDTTQWGREISKAILNVRIKGIGENKSTAVFPKLSFLHRKEINGSPESPNYDIKQLGIECSRKRLYPDWLSLDDGNLAEVYERSGQVVSGMGFIK